MCQNLNCSVLPEGKSPNNLTQEALARYHAIGALIDSHATTADGDIRLSNWIFRAARNRAGKAEPGFTREVRFLSFSIYVLFTDLQEILRATQRYPGLLVLAMVMPVVYGGVHLSVWNFEFPTAVEGLIWKITSKSVYRRGIIYWPSSGPYRGVLDAGMPSNDTSCLS